MGTYTEIVPHQKIEYHIEDGRKVEVFFFNAIDENTTEILSVSARKYQCSRNARTRLAKHLKLI